MIATAELISALEQRRIAGAALDVFDHEPQVPDALKTLNNVILTPHVAGLSPEATQGTVELVGKNLMAFFSGNQCSRQSSCHRDSPTSACINKRRQHPAAGAYSKR
ncbi:NAD(P)-dependent oxidoreductase [Pseudomonas parakoreensis]